MPLEDIIAKIIEEYWTTIWMGFVTLVVTGFVMVLIKNLIVDLANYFRAKMSDIGYGQRIYFGGEIFVIDEIRFKCIVAHDDKKKILIPTSTFLASVKEYPHHRYDDFDEKSYHQEEWNGVNDRREKREVQKR